MMKTPLEQETSIREKLLRNNMKWLQLKEVLHLSLEELKN
jgi:hypothetical protein